MGLESKIKHVEKLSSNQLEVRKESTDLVCGALNKALYLQLKKEITV